MACTYHLFVPWPQGLVSPYEGKRQRTSLCTTSYYVTYGYPPQLYGQRELTPTRMVACILLGYRACMRLHYGIFPFQRQSFTIKGTMNPIWRVRQGLRLSQNYGYCDIGFQSQISLLFANSYHDGYNYYLENSLDEGGNYAL